MKIIPIPNRYPRNRIQSTFLYYWLWSMNVYPKWLNHMLTFDANWPGKSSTLLIMFLTTNFTPCCTRVTKVPSWLVTNRLSGAPAFILVPRGSWCPMKDTAMCSQQCHRESLSKTHPMSWQAVSKILDSLERYGEGRDWIFSFCGLPIWSWFSGRLWPAALSPVAT